MRRMPSLAKAGQTWTLITPAPPREVFAVMEQMLGVPPYRFEATGEGQARIIEVERNGFFGQWKTAKRQCRWVSVTATVAAEGTKVEIGASRNSFRLSPRFNRSAEMRALQLIQLLSRGVSDRRTVYRERRIPAGPVSLVASWAGTPYLLYTKPDWSAPRGEAILTGTEVFATGAEYGPFVQVRVTTGGEGWVERDQIVPAPATATRQAQIETARLV